MFVGMQDFDVAQIYSLLPKFLPTFAQISTQFCPNLTNLAQIYNRFCSINFS